MTTSELAAREDLICAVLRRVTNERAEPHAHHGDDLDYADDMILDAARRLAAATTNARTVTITLPAPDVNIDSAGVREIAEADYGGNLSVAIRALLAEAVAARTNTDELAQLRLLVRALISEDGRAHARLFALEAVTEAARSWWARAGWPRDALGRAFAALDATEALTPRAERHLKGEA